MKLIINGEERDVQASTIAGVLAELGYQPGTVAVAVNEAFVPRTRHEEAAVQAGDRVEIVAPMQGG